MSSRSSRSSGRGRSQSEEGSSKKPGRPRSVMRSVSLGLRLSTGNKKSFVKVPKPLGDGDTIVIDLMAGSSYDEMIAQVKEAFFPNGSNDNVGSIDQYDLCLVNPGNSPIEEQVSGPFTLDAYMKTKRMKAGVVHLHLLCTAKGDVPPLAPRPSARRKRLTLRRNHNEGSLLVPLATSTPPTSQLEIPDSNDDFLPPSGLFGSSHNQGNIPPNYPDPFAQSYDVGPGTNWLSSNTLTNMTNELVTSYRPQGAPLTASLPQVVSTQGVYNQSQEAQHPSALANQGQGYQDSTYHSSGSTYPTQSVQVASSSCTSDPGTMNVSTITEGSKAAKISLQSFLSTSFNDVYGADEDQMNDMLSFYQTDELHEKEIDQQLSHETSDIGDLLRTLASHVGQEPQLRFLVRRRSVLQDSLIRLSKVVAEDLCGKLTVQFIGEKGLDEGGPKREFFTLFFQQLAESGLMTGGNLFHNGVELMQSTYRKIGWMIILSLAHGGPPPHLFSKGTASYLLSGGKSTVDIDIDDIPDSNPLKENLKQLMNTKDNAQLRQTIDVLLPDRFSMGYVKPTHLVTTQDLDTIKKVISHHVVIQDPKSELDQCMQGLELFDARTAMQKNVPGFQAMLTNTPKKLSMDDIMSVMEIRYSEEGTNFKEKEIDVVYAFSNFLQDVEGGMVKQEVGGTECVVELEDILQFVTGLRRLPPLGFPPDKRPQFVMNHVDTARMISSNTCAALLNIPVSSVTMDVDSFKEAMVFALFNNQGFGQR